MNTPTLTLAQVAALINAPAPARPQDAARTIAGVNTLAEAGPGDLSVLAHDRFVREYRKTRAMAVIVQRSVKVPADAAPPGAPVVLLADDADAAVAAVLGALAPPVPRPPAGVDALARVAATARLGEGAAVGPFAFVGERVVLGRNCVVHPGVYLGDDVTAGDDCEFFPNVVVRERATIGARVVIHAGSMIGSDGFGYRWDGARHAKIPHIGRVVIEDDVEIGSCVCVDRAKYSTTVIGRGTKVDNLVQVAHNVQVGPHCIIVGQAGLAGSVRLGAGVVLGGQTAVRDHVTMGDGAMAAACSAIADDIPAKSIVSGMPAIPHRQHLREQAAMRRLPDAVVHLRKVEERLTKLETGAGAGPAAT